MSDLTLAIIFRNPRQKRSPINNELFLFRNNGSSLRIPAIDEVSDAPWVSRPVSPLGPPHCIDSRR